MNKKAQRVGGAKAIITGNTDPKTSTWLQQGARNPGAMTGKQKRDRIRDRVRYDFDLRLIAAIKKAARSEDIDTSFSQFAEILLTVAMAQFLDGKLKSYFGIDNRNLSNSLRFRFDYELPDEIEQVAAYGAVDGAV